MSEIFRLNCCCFRLSGKDFISFINISGEKELVEFLAEEIVAERKAQKSKSIPSEIDGFKVKFDGAEVTLAKNSGKET